MMATTSNIEKHVIDYPEAYSALKEFVKEQNYSTFKCRVENGGYLLKFADDEQFYIPIKDGIKRVWDKDTEEDIKKWVNTFKDQEKLKQLIFGKDDTQNIVSCEVKDDLVEIFIEADGKVTSKFVNNKYWIVSAKKFDWQWTPLEGNLWYKFIKTYTNKEDYYKDRRKFQKEDLFFVSDPKEAAMIFNGFTYFKGMKVDDVSVLFFDIESMGLHHDENSRILLISNTFVKNGVVTRRLFAYDDYESDADFINDWCAWVRELNPSVMSGHNIYGYDLPYMDYCATIAGTSLHLGRDGSAMYISKRESKFRKDGSQDYMYYRSYIYGREIVDTMFVSYHFDFARKYESYALKQIIKQEGLEVEGRQFYDAALISQNYLIPEEWEKIKKYAEHDADDAWALYKLMIAAYFYLNQSVPKTFQAINYSASGSQINAFLIRSYLQEGHSLPKASPEQRFEGAISMGNPGKYKNVYKVDVASLYPSIMLQYEVFDRQKDPLANFSKMVAYFTEERLRNKKLAKETGDRYYKELQEAQKIIINSAYGMLGATGLLFNSPKWAEFVTMKGREILQTCIDWAIANGFQIVNADTDSISMSYNNDELSEQERKDILGYINEMYPSKIRFEDDGYYLTVLVLKAKNYVLYDGKKAKIKGSALKSSKIEKAMKEFMGKIIDNLLNKDDIEPIKGIYKEYIKEVFNLKDIHKWCSKKTITDKVLTSQRTNETKILAAVKDEDDVQMGNKIYVYFDTDSQLKLDKNWTGDHNCGKMLEKLYKTLKIFENVLDINQFPKYHLKNKKIQAELQEVINEA